MAIGIGPVQLRLGILRLRTTWLLGTHARRQCLWLGTHRRHDCRQMVLICSALRPWGSEPVATYSFLNERERQFPCDHRELLHAGNFFDTRLGTPSEIGIGHIP